MSTQTYTLVPAAPVLTPMGGTFTTVQTVTMTTTTPGAEIWYRTTGSDVYLSGGVPNSTAIQYDSLDPPQFDADVDLSASAFLPGWSLSTPTAYLFDITTAGININLLPRLNIGSGFTVVTFTNEHERWLILTISASDTYYLSFSDSEEGDGLDDVDVEVTIFESDQTTIVPGADALDFGYFSPHAVTLVPGDYLIRVEHDSFSTQVTGTASVRLTQ